MFGAFFDAAMNLPKFMHAEEMQEDAQVHSTAQMGYAQRFNAAEAEKAREFNSAQALAQRSWLEDMASTQHQRAQSDLRKAGLNPILAARTGSPVGGGSAASSAPASSSGGGPTGGSSPGTSSSFTQGEINSAQAKLLRSQEIATDQQAYNITADTERKRQETNLLLDQQKTEKARGDLMRNQASASAREVARSVVEEEIDHTTYGKIMRYIDRLRGGSSAFRNFTP